MSLHQYINIGGRHHVDRFYRYKMPALESDVKRRNKTVITNMVQIAKSLDRSAEEIIKFLGHALSSSGSYSAKTSQYQVSGKHSRHVLQSKIHEYCERFVICTQCEKPETIYVVKQNTIFLDCRGCGHRGTVNMGNKLCKYILIQQNLARQRKKKRAIDLESLTSKAVKKTVDKLKSESAGGLTKSTSDKKAKRKKQAKQIDECLHGEAFENPFFKKRGNPLFNGNFDQVPTFSGEDESMVREQAADEMKLFLEQSSEASIDAIVDAVTQLQESSRILFSVERVRILLEAAFAIDGMVSVRKYTDALAELSEQEKEMGEYFLAIAESVCANCVKQFPVLLMHLYEHDIVSERVILAWAHRKAIESHDQMLVSADEHARFRRIAEPFISWLEMESESDDC